MSDKQLVTVEERQVAARNKVEKYRDDNALVFVNEEDLNTQRIFIPEVSLLQSKAEDFHKISGKMMPKSYVVDRIKLLAGISFLPGFCGTRKEGSDVWVGFAQGSRRLPDGTLAYSNVTEHEFDVTVRSQEDFLNDKYDKYKTARAKEKHILELRKFARPRASTGARLRVIRELVGMPTAFDPKDALKPMVFCRVALNTDALLADPATRGQALNQAMGAQQQIYGPPAIEAKVEDVVEGEEEGVDEPSTAPPPPDDEAFPVSEPDPATDVESPIEVAMAKLDEWLGSDDLSAAQKDFIRRKMQGNTLDGLKGLIESAAAAGKAHADVMAARKKGAGK